MAAVVCKRCVVQRLSLRSIQTSAAVEKNIRAGVPKGTIDRSKPLTYEQSQKPSLIGVTKAWNSWNTSNLKDEGRTAETTWEDGFVRRFMTGTWHGLLASDIIVKRRHNTVVVAGLVTRQLQPRKMYFLLGYTEELLSHALKCPVKLEIQTVDNKKDTIFKYI